MDDYRDDPEILKAALRDAVRAFAQYSEGRNDVPERIVDDMVEGFVQGAQLSVKRSQKIKLR